MLLMRRRQNPFEALVRREFLDNLTLRRANNGQILLFDDTMDLYGIPNGPEVEQVENIINQLKEHMRNDYS
jgi:light-regulated signal transduction histidine kinase (bacteriophytochrome)